MKSLLFIAAFALAAPGTAQTPAVDAARAAGIIGERYDGYVGVHGAASAAVRSQVARINIERRWMLIRATWLRSAADATPCTPIYPS